MLRFFRLALFFALLAPALAHAQPQPVPQPFPRPGGQRPPSEPAPATQDPAAPMETATTFPEVPSTPEAPTEQMLGLPIYPTAQFLASYDAGRGQRYYLFGTNLSFQETVAYYRNVLNKGGDLVFETPATHMFEVGRFDEDLMAFPPGITVKDYTWNGSPGYANPRAGVEPTHFRVVIQIVPSVTGPRR